MTRRLFAAILAVAVASSASSGPAAAPAQAQDYVPVTGSGSTWSSIAVDQWRSDVRRQGLVVNYNPNGSTAGRQDFNLKLTDFAVSEIPFQSIQDGQQGGVEYPTRSFSYLPIVAGGTSFMYHLTVGGRRVTNLRLSGDVITRIFTGGITNWSDPAITADNGGIALPSKPITPVVRADGSGTSAQFTLWMSKQHPGIWNPFCQRYLFRPPPCGLTSFYPTFPGTKAQRGSDGVSNYVASSFGDGSITYVEYGYALVKGFPVVKVRNAAGYYTLPTASNVAVALTQAQINTQPGPGYLTQVLDGVYQNRDDRTYPLSSYSYFIVPRDTPDPPFNLDKGRSLSTFINYFLCYGQQKAETLGYSPLPKNLVVAGLDQVDRIPGHVPTPARTDAGLAACDNPTFRGGRNVLLENAAYPAACDKAGARPCGAPAVNPGTNTGGGNGSTTGGGTGTQGGGTGAVPSAEASPLVDPLTGELIEGEQEGAAGLVAAPVNVAGRPQSNYVWLAVALVAELLALMAIPPLVMRWRRRGRGQAVAGEAGGRGDAQ